jgi:nucleotide-binding universal stress UspA family protein
VPDDLTMITRIVVPLDGSALARHALPTARSIALTLGASVVLLTTHWTDGVGDAQHHLDDQAAKLGQELGATPMETLLVHDRDAPGAILAQAEEDGTVVCMATHGRSGFGEAVLGSVAEGVVRRSRQPLILVGPNVDPEFPVPPGDVLVPVDGSSTSEAALPIARQWATSLRRGLRVMEVLPAGKGIVERSREEESTYVRRLADALDDQPTIHWEVLHALDPGDAIVTAARRERAALIAISTHGRSGVGRLVLGSVAMRVVHQSPCAVLVTGPPHTE